MADTIPTPQLSDDEPWTMILGRRCRKCDLPLPDTHRYSYCGSSKRHACWIDDRLNMWRREQGYQSQDQLIGTFFGSIDQHIVIEGGSTQRAGRLEPKHKEETSV